MGVFKYIYILPVIHIHPRDHIYYISHFQVRAMSSEARRRYWLPDEASGRLTGSGAKYYADDEVNNNNNNTNNNNDYIITNTTKTSTINPNTSPSTIIDINKVAPTSSIDIVGIDVVGIYVGGGGEDDNDGDKEKEQEKEEEKEGSDASAIRGILSSDDPVAVEPLDCKPNSTPNPCPVNQSVSSNSRGAPLSCRSGEDARDAREEATCRTGVNGDNLDTGTSMSTPSGRGRKRTKSVFGKKLRATSWYYCKNTLKFTG